MLDLSIFSGFSPPKRDILLKLFLRPERLKPVSQLHLVSDCPDDSAQFQAWAWIELQSVPELKLGYQYSVRLEPRFAQYAVARKFARICAFGVESGNVRDNIPALFSMESII